MAKQYTNAIRECGIVHINGVVSLRYASCGDTGLMPFFINKNAKSIRHTAAFNITPGLKVQVPDDLGRAYSHRMPLARLKRLSEKG